MVYNTNVEQASSIGLDRLKKSRPGSVWTGHLGPDQLKKLGAGLDGDRSMGDGRPLERYSREGIYFGAHL